jgi:hypothetical protein
MSKASKIPGFIWLEGDEVAFRLMDPDSIFPHDFAAYARAYRSAAEKLHELGLGANKGSESLFPIAFLWRQYLELTLKWIVLRLGGKRKHDRLLDTHDILWLWDQAELVFRKAWPNAKEHRWIRKLLVEFHKLDPGSYAFRYPVTKDGKPT